MIKQSLLVFFILSLIGCSSSNNKLKTILILGQDNMVGWGNVETIPKEDLEKFETTKDNIFYFSYFDFKFKQPYNLKRKHSHYLDDFGIKTGETFSVALPIQNRLADLFPKEKFLLLHYAIAGASLYSSWHPDWTEERARMFVKQISMPSKHQLYEKLQDKILDAERLATKEGYKGLDIQGILWFQGENDALRGQPAEEYQENLSYFISKIREDLKKPELPFIIQQTNSTPFPYTGDVRAAQEQVADNLNNVKLIKTEFTKEPMDFPKYDDDLHYNTEGILKLGKLSVDYLVEFL